MPRCDTLTEHEHAVLMALRAPGQRTLTPSELLAVAKVAKGLITKLSGCSARPTHCRLQANIDINATDAAVRLGLDLPPEPVTL